VTAKLKLDAMWILLKGAELAVCEVQFPIGDCGALTEIYERTDGQTSSPDFVTGSAAPTLANMIEHLITSLSCH
jgi:hypothetical protein